MPLVLVMSASVCCRDLASQSSLRSFPGELGEQKVSAGTLLLNRRVIINQIAVSVARHVQSHTFGDIFATSRASSAPLSFGRITSVIST